MNFILKSTRQQQQQLLITHYYGLIIGSYNRTLKRTKKLEPTHCSPAGVHFIDSCYMDFTWRERHLGLRTGCAAISQLGDNIDL